MEYNKGSLIYNVKIEYSEELREKLKVNLMLMGDNINFENDKWICNKLKDSVTVSNSSVTATFKQIPEQYKDLVKYFVILRSSQINTTINDVRGIMYFFKFIKKMYMECETIQLNRNIIEEYKKQLKLSTIAIKTKETRWTGIKNFFKIMFGWPELPSYVLISKIDSPFSCKGGQKKNNKKYPPNEVIEQLDRAFLCGKAIKLWEKLTYLLMRLYPTRIGDIVLISLNDFLRPFGDSKYILTFPLKKESKYMNPEERIVVINIQNKIENLLIDLIKKQIKMSKKYQRILSIDKRGFLFTIPTKIIDKAHYKKTGIKKYIINKNFLNILNDSKIRRNFKSISQNNNVTYKGEPYTFKTHQLRHKNITDRLDFGFSILETMCVSGIKTPSVIYDSYDHNIEGKHREIESKYNGEKKRLKENEENSIFRGKVLGEMAFKRLLERRSSFELSNPKGESYGACADIYKCFSVIADPLVCIECKFNSSNEVNCNKDIEREQLIRFYQEQVKRWESDVHFFKINDNVLYAETAQKNLKLFSKKLNELTKGKNIQGVILYAERKR